MYSAYGLSLRSELELPELRACSFTKAPDATIVLGSVPVGGPPGGRQVAPNLWGAHDVIWFAVPGVARFKVSNGSKIVVDPEPDSDTASMRVYLLGSCLGAMLFQRGLLVLHGNAIEIDGKCMICVGPSGVGKSTLTAAFLQRGFRVLADDVVPIDPSRNAIPGYPRIKLWQDVADKLGIETKKLDEIRPGMKKYNYPLGTAFCDKPIPVGMICLLSPHAKDTIEVTRVQGMDRFSALYGNTYRQQFVEGMGLQSAHLRQCGELGARTSILRVSRPTSGFRIEALMQCLLEAMREIA